MGATVSIRATAVIQNETAVVKPPCPSRDFDGILNRYEQAWPISLDRMVEAVELVRERLLRATAALDKAGVPYAVAGGIAVAAWVSRIDRSAGGTLRTWISYCGEMILISRQTPLPARNCSCRVWATECFSTGRVLNRAKLSTFCSPKKRYERIMPPRRRPSRNRRKKPSFKCSGLSRWVRMKLTSYRLRGPGPFAGPDWRRLDRRHLARAIFPPLDARLQELLADPEG